MSVYATNQSSGGSPYATRGNNGTPVPKKKKGRGGVLGVVERGVTDLRDAAVNTPAGLYEVGKAVVKAAGGNPGDLVDIGGAIVQQTAQDFRHPLRHPGNTLLGGLGVLSLGAGTVARVGAVGKAATAVGDAGRAGRIAKAAFTSPREKRVIRVKNAEGKTLSVTKGNYSRSALSRRSQKILDGLREAHPETRLIPLKKQATRFGKANAKQMAILQRLDASDAAALVNATKGVSNTEFAAVKASLAGTTIPERIAYHEKQLASGKLSYRGRTRTKQEIAFLRDAGKQGLVDGDANLTDARLQSIKDLITGVATKRKNRLIEAGVITPERAAARDVAEQQLIRGAFFFTRKHAQEAVRAAKDSAAARVKDVLGQIRATKKGFYTSKGEAARFERQYFRLATTRGAAERDALANRRALLRQDAFGSLDEDFGAAAAADIRTTLAEIERERAALAAREKHLAAITSAEKAYAQIEPLRESLARIEDELAAEITAIKSRVGKLQPPSGFTSLADMPLRPSIRVPFKAGFSPRAVHNVKGVGQGGVVGLQKVPGTFNHSFLGVILKHGGGRKNLGRVVAEDYLDAVRWWNSEETRARFREIGQVSPVGLKDPVAVRVGRPVKLREDIRALVSKSDTGGENLTKAEKARLQEALGSEFARVFPQDVVRPQEGVVFVERALLGGLDKPNPLVGVSSYGGAAKALSVFDAINNAERASILYLKPAYAVPNALGNLALAIVQQGFAAPRNLAQAARLATKTGRAKYGADVIGEIDTVMEEGMSAALSINQGLGNAAVRFAAEKWSKVVDLPFRRSSFFHEARAAGYKTPAQIKDLFDNPAKRDDLVRIVTEANNDLIDYANLGPWERNLIRRIIFFYPWVKGSTVYAGRFVRDHPVLAAETGSVGQYGTQVNKQNFGDLPSWAQGLVKVGGSSAFPSVVNPASLALFQTPAQVLAAASTPIFGGSGSAYEPLSQLSPSAAAIVTLLMGQNSLGRQLPPGESRAAEALKGLYQGQPYYNLVQRLTQDQSGKTYRYSPAQAVGQVLLGGSLVPRTANRAKLNKSAARENSGR